MVALVVPPLLNGLIIVAGKLPAPAEIQAWVASLQAQLGTIPEPMRTIALAVMTQTAANLQGVLQGLADQAAGVITNQILGIFGTASNLLGLLVIPAWILTMVSDERTIKRRVGRLFPEAIRPDVLALFRIVDRTLGTFLRVRVLLGVVAGFLVWAGLEIAQQLGFGPFNYAVAAAVLLGTLQLIPELGFFLGFFPILLAFAIGGPVSGAGRPRGLRRVGQDRLRPRGDPHLARRPRRAPGAADPGHRRAQPVRRHLAAGRGTGRRDRPRSRALCQRPPRRAARSRRRPARREGEAGQDRQPRREPGPVRVPRPGAESRRACERQPRRATPRAAHRDPRQTPRSAPVPAVYMSLQPGVRPAVTSQRSTQP